MRERKKNIYICCFLIEKERVCMRRRKNNGSEGTRGVYNKKEKRKEETDLIVPKTFVTYKYNYVIVIQNAQV